MFQLHHLIQVIIYFDTIEIAEKISALWDIDLSPTNFT